MKGIKAILGANIKYYRKKQRFSQEQLAEKLEITAKHLSTIETGATFVSAELLEKFTRHLLVSASTLFYSVDEISTDDSLLGKIDQIIDKECEKTSNTIKMQIRYLSSQPAE
jgi:transcriptional regulator with XRE-family HTH domain